MGKVPFHLSVAACAAAFLPSVGLAASDAEVAALRAEIARVKAEYAERISKLEALADQLQTTGDTGATAAVDESLAAAAPVAVESAGAPAVEPPPQAPRSASTFNPAISLILAGNYAEPVAGPGGLRASPGFVPAGDEIGPGERSFNLGESELTLAASVDPYFMGSLTVAITGENEIEVEEAYFRTIALPAGFTLKGGRFFSEPRLPQRGARRTPGTSSTSRSSTRRSSAASWRRTACSSSGSRRRDFLLELGVETGNGDDFPGTRREPQRPERRRRSSRTSAATSAIRSQLARRRVVDRPAMPRIASYEDVDAAGRTSLNAFTGIVADLGRGCRASSGRRTATRSAAT